MGQVTGIDQDRERDHAVDVARGLAVLAMVWVHFVPEPVDPDSDFWSACLSASVHWLDGLPAAMFLLLVGVSWGMSRWRSPAHVARRSLCLALIGCAFWVSVWPNDILMPIALMALALYVICRLGRRVIWITLMVLLASVPVATILWGDYAWSDVRADGTHEANHRWGWCTVRYFLIDGAYPMLPWLAFPLCGTLLVRDRSNARMMVRWMICSAALAAVAVTVARLWGDEYQGGFAAMLAITWQPTSLAFVFFWGGAAVFFVSGLFLWISGETLPCGCRSIAAVGRASLTHYLFHLAFVYSLMRVWWPSENWPPSWGIAVALGYAAFALIATPRWFAAMERGPVEEVLARGSGR